MAKLAHFAERRRLRFPALADPEAMAIRAFGVLNKQSSYGGLPHPIIFVINDKGIVTHRFSRSGYTSRPEIANVLTALKKK